MNFRIRQNSISDGFTVKQAESADIQTISMLLKEAAGWLQSKGSTQWSELLDSSGMNGLASSIEKEEVFLFEKEGSAAGMVMLLAQPGDWDRSLWGDDQQSHSIYLHKLVTANSFKGSGLGMKILTWAEQGIEFDGKDRIRLDCIETNSSLNSFYQSAEYLLKGCINGFCKYEKTL
ncbi:GNAT family N-acetyltransferase [Metabacillus sp. KIGAM252]|uniref:GNAT family N-acetyltransferase n=1 Tax=Metabacillus flavus TaxID=2823519 RepID=A0ABS5LIE4_9BACI|nr:GNAT family N-acetyltransferase [Metabacillus flavus]MBS2970477.1 GNAT family N-acetyltransferase [Metabacillus flavus]